MATAEAIIEALQLRLEVDEYGTKRYYNHNNEQHRTDGPAVIYSDGDKFWFQNGELHRTDGHAIEWADSEKKWFLNNAQFTKANFLKHPLCTIK